MKIKLNRNRGFTLVEVLVTLAILGAIMIAMSMTVQTLMKNSAAKKAETIALRQVENAGYWISRDIQEADEVYISPEAGIFLRLLCFHWNGTAWEPNQQVDYLVDADGRMLRNIGLQSLFIADYLSGVGTDTRVVVQTDNVTYKINIKASYRNVDVTGEYISQVRVPDAGG